ncbi:hypothetical protein BASA83_012145 [Batrachochytrium salamandrivorans]|nr:hypothetical protein BASA83_012145 [Batrachochytrium salamandrivorans]
MLGEIDRDDAGRSWAYAIYSSVYGVVGILGPILGGLLADPAKLTQIHLGILLYCSRYNHGNESNRYSETDIDIGYSNHVAGECYWDELTSITSLPLVRDVDSVASQLEDNVTMGSERRPSPSPRNSLIPESATSNGYFPATCNSRLHISIPRSKRFKFPQRC